MKTIYAIVVATVLVGVVVAQQETADRFPTQTVPAAGRAIAQPPVATTVPQHAQFFRTPVSRLPALTTAPQPPQPPTTLWSVRSQRNGQNRFIALNSPHNKELMAAQRKVDAATNTLTKAKGDDIAEAEEALEEALSELFDQKTAVREAQINELEKELTHLRSQLDERIDQKGRIVRLKLQTLVNDAKGLTF